jgi:hypothetical protein
MNIIIKIILAMILPDTIDIAILQSFLFFFYITLMFVLVIDFFVFIYFYYTKNYKFTISVHYISSLYQFTISVHYIRLSKFSQTYGTGDLIIHKNLRISSFVLSLFSLNSELMS